MTARSVAREAVWIHKLLAGLFGQIPEPTVIHYDNRSCVQMSMNPVFHDNLKHIETQYHFIHDMVQKGAVELKYISTDDQSADILTKPLPRVKFEYFRGRLRVEENVSLLQRER